MKSMVKFKQDNTIYIKDDNKESSEFTFKKGYSYPCKMKDGYLIVGSDLKFNINTMMNYWDRMKYLEE